MMKEIRVGVIGAGPAGMSAALWLKNLGMSPVVIEKSTTAGGMLNVNFLENDWILGQQNITGVELANNFFQHIVNEEIELLLEKDIQSIEKKQGKFFLELMSENANKNMDEIEVLNCDAIIFAAGTRYLDKTILSDCEGFSDIESHRIIEGPYAFLHLDQLLPQRVLIVGAGDNAFENAMMLLEKGFAITMVSRSEPKAQAKFLDAVIDHPDFTLLSQVSIKKMKFCKGANGKGEGEWVLSIEGQLFPFDRLHVLAGYQPNTDSLLSVVDTGLKSAIEVDQQGFLVVDSACHTSVSGLYAAGDIANTQFPCVVSAIALGAQAAKSISQDFSR